MAHKKILFTGPECSGKTTSALYAASQWNAAFVPEYARYFLENSEGLYEEKDLRTIARGQIRAELMAERIHEIIVCDTSLLVIDIWMLERFGMSLWSDEFQPSHMTSYDQVYLCKPDFPWEFDSLRENEHDRLRLWRLYEMALIKMEVPIIHLSGDLSQRKQIILKNSLIST